MNAIKKNLKGFTLIELLIVIAILGILIVALLVAINPLEAQKKARDAKRLANLQTMNTIMNQYVSDNTIAAAINITSVGAGAVYVSQPCAANWTTLNTCLYGQTVPTDPINARAGVTVQGTAAVQTMAYGFAAGVNGDYEVDVFMESAANLGKVSGDGGAGATAAYTVEAGTNLALR